jgi:peptide/nickel transport system permease protein
MIMAGARSSLSVALIAVALGAGAGIPLGALAASRDGWLDGLVMRGSDLAFAFPALLTAVMITALAGPGAANAMLAIGIFNIPVFARVTRGAALQAREMDYVMAARAVGRSEIGVMLLHVLPNIVAVLVVQVTIQFALAIVADAGLSYLGLGTQPPFPSWGRMLNDAQTYIYRAPLLAVFPGLAIMLSVLGLNLLGDGLRDLLDPRLNGNKKLLIGSGDSA